MMYRLIPNSLFWSVVMTIWYPFKSFFESEPANSWPIPELDDPFDDEEIPFFQPTAAPVHVLAAETKIRCSEGRLVIEQEGKDTIERPMEYVSALHIHGWSHVTSPCLHQLMKQGSPIIWRSVTGYPICQTHPIHQHGLQKRMKHYQAYNKKPSLQIAQALVSAKINNMRGIIRRKMKSIAELQLKSMLKIKEKAYKAKNIPSLLGLEGAATAKYFAYWPRFISSQAEGFSFEMGRTKRPPQDKVNAALSYAYALLIGECQCAIVGEGLDPRLGFLHSQRAGRPALALDIAEPFRPLIADLAVLRGINLRKLKAEHFEEIENGISLTENGKKIVIALLEERYNTETKFPGLDNSLPYRTLIGIQCKAISDALLNNTQPKMMEMP